MSLDGCIAGPHGEFDWIPNDPDIDFAGLFAQFDTLVMGRKTFDISVASGGDGTMEGVQVVVFSNTLDPAKYPKVRVRRGDPAGYVRQLKQEAGKDIWLYGGGELFRVLLEAGLVDTVEIAVVPVLVGGGIAMLPPPAPRTPLVFRAHRVYPKSGIVLLEYDVRR